MQNLKVNEGEGKEGGGSAIPPCPAPAAWACPFLAQILSHLLTERLVPPAQVYPFSIRPVVAINMQIV